MTKTVETVLGPAPVEQLGKTLIHEHFLFGYPGFQGDVTHGPFHEDEALRVAVEAAEKMKRHGIQTVVDPTPNDCGRNPAFLRRVAEETGLNIISCFATDTQTGLCFRMIRSTFGSAARLNCLSRLRK